MSDFFQKISKNWNDDNNILELKFPDYRSQIIEGSSSVIDAGIDLTRVKKVILMEPEFLTRDEE